VRGSFSASSLVIWAPQVAGGDEPPSVLSDNLFQVWLSSQTFSSGAPYAAGTPRPGSEAMCSKGHKLVSQSVALPRRLPLRWKAARFRFVIKQAEAVGQGGRTQRHPMCLLRSRVRLPNSAGRRLAGNVPGESGGGGTSGPLSRQGMRESPGVKRSQRCISRTA
jgi:hypothetical protein